HADLRLRKTKLRFGRSHAKVAAERHFQPAADAGTLDRGDSGLLQLLQAADQLLQLSLQPADFFAAGIGGEVLEEQAEVDSRAEACTPCAAEDQRSERSVLRRLLQRVAQERQHLVRERVALLRTIERYDHHVVAALADQVGHFHASSWPSRSSSLPSIPEDSP